VGPYAEPDSEQESMRETSSFTPLHVTSGPLCIGSPSAHAASLSFNTLSFLTECRAFQLKTLLQE
jgi:hypothetical protein